MKSSFGFKSLGDSNPRNDWPFWVFISIIVGAALLADALS